MDRFGVSSEEGLMVGGRYLSKEVMCRILGRLPTRSFLRLRILFLIWESAADSAKPLLAFDLLSRKWRLFPLLEGAWSKLTVLSSSRGLLLATTANGDGENDFITVNPLTKLLRQIPPMIDVNSLKFNVRQIVMDAAMEGKYSEQRCAVLAAHLCPEEWRLMPIAWLDLSISELRTVGEHQNSGHRHLCPEEWRLMPIAWLELSISELRTVGEHQNSGHRQYV
ncbi:hypothetical protein R1sor_002739 [Riccia sorocarpa]|uniref:F-box domain-containing protein n=1 Tax=Riccia sorocarpa TaxID=122646 RepID=A0ABD3H2A8_9MARC